MRSKTFIFAASGFVTVTSILLSAGPSAATPEPTAVAAAAADGIARAAADLGAWDILVALFGSDRADIVDAPSIDRLDVLVGDNGTGGNESTQE